MSSWIVSADPNSSAWSFGSFVANQASYANELDNLAQRLRLGPVHDALSDPDHSL